MYNNTDISKNQINGSSLSIIKERIEISKVKSKNGDDEITQDFFKRLDDRINNEKQKK
jgi:hypothetical protein